MRSLINRLTVVLLLAAWPSFAAPSRIEGLKVRGVDVVNGASVDLTPSTRKPLVVAFLSARCPCSESHEPVLKKLAQEFGSSFSFVGIHANRNETRAESTAHFKNAGLGFSVIEDQSGGGGYLDRFEALKTPHVYVVAASGEVLYQGGIDDASEAPRAKVQHLKNALTDISQGRAPAQRETRTLGCAIKR